MNLRAGVVSNGWNMHRSNAVKKGGNANDAGHQTRLLAGVSVASVLLGAGAVSAVDMYRKRIAADPESGVAKVANEQNVAVRSNSSGATLADEKGGDGHAERGGVKVATEKDGDGGHSESGGGVKVAEQEVSDDAMYKTFEAWLNYGLSAEDNEMGVALEIYSQVMDDMFRAYMNKSSENRVKIVDNVYGMQYAILKTKGFKSNWAASVFRGKKLSVKVKQASDSVVNLFVIPSRVYAVAYEQWFGDFVDDEAEVKKRALEIFEACGRDPSKYLTTVLCGFLWTVMKRVSLPL
eukprot:3932075-Rhodomonas_salina.2